MRPQTLGVIGLGAIGGSVAWQAARAGTKRVLGFSPQPKESVAAAKCGAITDVASSARAVADRADLVVLATPPAATLTLLAQLAPRLRARNVVCTDVCSVKAPLAAAARRADLEHRFAGSHPLAGTHLQGFPAAAPDRFRGQVVYVTPVGAPDGPSREVADFWASVLEAHAVIVEPDVHDELLAWTSHLPQVISSALAETLARSGPRGVTYGRGAVDTTRLAGSSTTMWRDVLLLNRSSILPALERYEESLGALRRALADGDVAAVTAWLSSGAAWRRRFGD